jgi:predicted metalloprotease
MRWDDFRRSDNVEDTRGEEGGGGGMGIPIGGGGIGIGTVIILGLIGWALGIDPSILIGGAEIVNSGRHVEQPYQPQSGQTTSKPADQMGDFVAAVLGNTEDTWKEIFKQNGQQYTVPRLRLYSGVVQGGCGMAQAAMGPFYCPNDRRIYLDTSFFRDIQARFRGCSGKACEFAEAYVIAHEAAMQTAAAIGDDRLQQQSRGYVVPDAFTHGSSEQRQRWFMTGLKEGKVSACNTFSGQV